MNLRQGGFLIAKIHQVSGRIFAKILKENRVEFNPAQGRILFALWGEDGIPIQVLAQRTQLGKSTLTSMLDRLEDAGQIVRMPSTADRREVLIVLTEKNRRLQQRYVEVSKEMTDIFYDGFSTEEIESLEDYLTRVLDNLTKNAAE
jgi:DNA-binding MarR family transcriptional regulator